MSEAKIPPERTRPPRVALALGERQLVFVHIDGDRYAAELDGTRRPLRSRSSSRDVYESGGSTPGRTTELEGATANIDALLHCLALDGTKERPCARGLELSVTESGGHFRRNTFWTVTVTAEEDGAILFAVDRAEQDESYY
jgi:hypothetical protein